MPCQSLKLDFIELAKLGHKIVLEEVVEHLEQRLVHQIEDFDSRRILLKEMFTV